MFDDLHDPNPPDAGMAALAAVTRRAQQIRRRRSLAFGGAGVAVVALAVAAFVLPGRDADRVVSVDEPTTSEAQVPTTQGTAPPSTSIPPASSDATETTTGPEESCTAEAAAPLFLPDGSPAGVGVETNVDGRAVTRWGDEATGIVDLLDPAATSIDQQPDGAVIGGRDIRAHLDPPIGDTSDVRITTGECIRHYVLRSFDGGEVAYLQTWLDGLTVMAGLSVSWTPTDVCVTVAAPARAGCSSFEGDGVSAALYPMEGTSVWVLVAVLDPEWALERISRAALAVPAQAGENTVVIDVLPAGACVNAIGPEGAVPAVRPLCSDSFALTPNRPVVAIDANGDAVTFRDPPLPSVVIDDSDPDDLAPPENPSVFDHLVALPDGSGYVVGGCCEAPNGYLLFAERSNTPGGGRFIADGRLPALTDSGNLAWSTPDGIVLGAVDGSISMTLLELDPAEWTVRDLAVVQRGSGLEEVLVLAASADGTYLIRVFAGGGDMRLTQRVSDLAGEDAQLSLAGWREDAFYVLDGTNDRMLAFDAEDLQPTASDVRTSDGEVVRWRSAWLTPTLPRHVEENGELWVADSSWGGEYVWVR